MYSMGPPRSGSAPAVKQTPLELMFLVKSCESHAVGACASDGER